MIFYTSADDFTQALLVMLVTNFTSVARIYSMSISHLIYISKQLLLSLFESKISKVCLRLVSVPFAHCPCQYSVCEVTFQTKYCLPPGATKISEEIATEIGGFDVKV